jgi:hypothetical protein
MGLAIIVVLGLLGVRGLFWVYRDTALILDSRNWVMGEAIIDKSWLDKTWHKATPNYSLMMDYHFSIAGIAYTGDRFKIPSRRSSGDEGYFRKQLAPYSPGAVVKIYYDPKDPNRNMVTHPEMNYFFTFFLGGLSFLLCAISSFVIYVFLHNKYADKRIENQAV